MIGSIALYAGLALGLVGAVALLRPLPALRLGTRWRALTLVAFGVLLVAIAIALPVRETSVLIPTTRLDLFVPTWQFAERHGIRIHAEPARVEAAVRTVTAREIRLFRPLTWIRRPRIPPNVGPEGILTPPADEPILDVALRSGFLLLDEEPLEEIVFGTLVVVPAELSELPPAERERRRDARSSRWFRDLSEAGWAKAAMNFRLVDEGQGWTRLTTETRVFATDDATRRRFTVYWRLIYPGSSLIRYTWLAAIRDRAEASSTTNRPRSEP